MPIKSDPTPVKAGYIRIQGASTNTLQRVNVTIPHRQLIVITGISGSGKSSLGFGTLFAEGCRRYIESFSAHARQFLEKIKRPPVDSIQGILPSIGLSRKGRPENPRARVGTTTDIYDYIKLLYARLGVTYAPGSGEPVKKNTVEDVVNYIAGCKENDKIIILAPLHIPKNRTWKETLEIELGKGFTRMSYQGKIQPIEEVIKRKISLTNKAVYVVIDRLKISVIDDVFKARVADSAKIAFFEGQGVCVVEKMGGTSKIFSDRFEADGQTFEEPSVHFFSFHNPQGSCRTCDGSGKILGIDPQKVIPDPSLSIKQGAILPWQSAPLTKWQKNFLTQQEHYAFPIHRPYQALTEEEKTLLWKGSSHFEGIEACFTWVLSKSDKVQYRILYASYHGSIPCDQCQGTGLRKEVTYVKLGGKNVVDLLLMPVEALYDFFMEFTVPPHQKKVGKILLQEIQHRLLYLKKVGLGYLTLNRFTNTLSGGEYQRTRLAKMLGSPLVDNLYVLDEPTAGLHQRDAKQLVEVLLALKKAGNTVVVVGHEELMMRAADHIIDMGPEAGTQGGQVVFQGGWSQLLKAVRSYTAAYLTGKKKIPIPKKRRSWEKKLLLQGAHKHNIKNVDIVFPLEILTVVSGVSGSGKSTLIDQILYPALCNHLSNATTSKQNYRILKGNIRSLVDVVYMGQNALSRSSRSNLVTYLGAYDYIRELFAKHPLAIERDYYMGHFSFNSPGGRCENCLGEGKIKIDMQFMEDVSLTCEVCQGKRFQEDVLEVQLDGKSIVDVLNMTVTESLVFFKDYTDVVYKLKPLVGLGLGFLRLGQASSTFSSGEAQRVKLAYYLNQQNALKRTFFIFNEPTTGLHVHDIRKLLKAFEGLIGLGHTVLVVDHHMEMIKSADWIIDLGPEGGMKGGQVVFTGRPEEMIQCQNNHTAYFLGKKLTLERSL